MTALAGASMGGFGGFSGGNPYGAVGGGLPNPYQGYGTASYPANAGNALNAYYGQQLAFQGANYANTLGLYNQIAAAAGAGYGGLAQGVLSGGADVNQAYQGLENQVVGGIQGIQQSQLNANQAAYAQQTGQSLQGLAAAGLGNTTVGSSIQSGLLQQKQLADTAVQNQFAQLQAGYQSQLGGAGIAAQQQANQLAAQYQAQGFGTQAQLGSQEAAWMGGLQLPQWNPQALGGMVQSSQDLLYAQSQANQGPKTGGTVGPNAPGTEPGGPYGPSTATGAGGYIPGYVPTGSGATGAGGFIAPGAIPGFYGEGYNQPSQGDEWGYGSNAGTSFEGTGYGSPGGGY